MSVLVPFLIAYHLNGYQFIVLVVQAFQDLSKGAFPDHFKHLKPVSNVVMQHLKRQKEEHYDYLSIMPLLKNKISITS